MRDFRINHSTVPPTDCSQNASSNMERKGYMTVLLHCNPFTSQLVFNLTLAKTQHGITVMALGLY